MRESADTVDEDVHAVCRQQHQYSRLFHGRKTSGQQRPEVSCRFMEMETVVSRLEGCSGSSDHMGGVWEAGRTFGG